MKNLVFQSKNLVIRSRTLDFGRNTYEIRLPRIFKIPRISNEKPSILIEIPGISMEILGILKYYSLVPNCGGSNCKFWEKTPQVNLIIITE